MCACVSPQKRSNDKLSQMKGGKAWQINQLNTNASRIKTRRTLFLLRLLLYEHNEDKLVGGTKIPELKTIREN